MPHGDIGRRGGARNGHGRPYCDVSGMQRHENAPLIFVRAHLRPAECLANDFFECPSEVAGESGVDEGVDGRVAIAEPEDDAEYQLGYAICAKSSDQVHCEEGKPATDETPHDDAQCFSSFRFHAKSSDLQQGRVSHEPTPSLLQAFLGKTRLK